MYNIVKIEDAVQGYYAITVCEPSGNKTYTVRVAVYVEIGTPCRGDVLTGDILETIRQADEYYRAKRAALSILSYGDNNKSALYTKLRTRQISESVSTEVVAEMVALGYIDERRQLARIIASEANRKLIGPKKIVPKLLSKGYALADIKAVLSELCSDGEVDFDENRERLLSKTFGEQRDYEQMKKLLFKYGYDF